MAARKKAVQQPITTTVAGFFIPAPDKLLAAGFVQSSAGPTCWHWEGNAGGGPEYGGRFWIYLWLHKDGQFFIHHVNKPRAAEKAVKQSVATGDEFTSILVRFGWKR